MSTKTRLTTLVLSFISLNFIGCSGEDNPTAPAPDPVANFTMSGSTVAPAIITFNNQSTNADRYDWDFGDGRSSTLENPEMTFDSPGTFSVRLVSTSNATSRSHSISRELVITYPNPVANFSMSGATVSPASITFTNLSRNADQYEWDFGDGRTSSLEDPVVAFSSYGEYDIRLVVTRSATMRTATITKSLNITPGRVYIETIRIEQIPFVDRNGSGWDFGSGPDIFWTIDNSAGTELVDSDTYYENVAPADLPIIFTQSPLPYRLPNASAEYTIWLWDYDPADANDLMIGGTFDLSDAVLAGDYRTEMFWDNPQRPFRMRVTIRWQ